VKPALLLRYKDVLETYTSEYHGIKALAKHKWWFPLYSSDRLAGLVADLMCDGHLQAEKLRIDYTAKHVKELQRFNREVISMFGVRGLIRRNVTNTYGTYNIGVNCRPLGRTLLLAGVPAGAKVFMPFRIPAWIRDDKALFGQFMNRFVSCEGCIDLQGKYIDMDMYKSEGLIAHNLRFFEDIKEGLKHHFDITTTNPFVKGISVRKDGRITRGVHLKIKRKESLLRFARRIGIENEEKNGRLHAILS